MKTLRLTIQRIFWVMLCLLGLGLEQQITWAAEGELEYRFERMVPQQEQSWSFNQPQGIAIASDGSLWVADTGNNHIQHLNVDGTFITQFGSQGSGVGQFSNPTGIAVAADGSVWVVDTGNNRVQHFNIDGTVIIQVGSEGNDVGHFSFPKGITVATDSSVWVADYGNNRIQHFINDGTFMAQFGSYGSGVGQFFNPSGIAIAIDGSVWVADTNNSRIQHYKNDGTFIAQFGSYGNGIGQFSYPEGIALAVDGGVWVSDWGNNRMQHFNPDGTIISQLGSQGNGIGQFNDPKGLAVAADGSLWVADTGNNRIQHFNADGGFIAQFGSQGNGLGQIKTPIKIELTNDNSMWVIGVADGISNLQHLNVDGRVIAQFFGSRGVGSSELSRSFVDIAEALDSSLWLVEGYSNSRPYGYNTIQHFNSDGSLIVNFGVYDQTPGFYAPVHIKLSQDGSVWVLDSSMWILDLAFGEQYPIKHYSNEGGLIEKFGDWNIDHGQLSSMDIAKDNSLWVLDSSYSRILHIKADGTFISQFGSYGQEVGQFENPSDIAVTGDSSLLVADAGNNRIQHFDADGKFITAIGSAGSSAGQFNFPQSIAIFSDGGFWLADSGNNRIQKFAPRPKGTTAHPYKAIILAGGGKKIGSRVNALWDSTWQVAQKANNALEYQGFKNHEEIQFLTAGNTQFDLDNNTQLDDLQAATKDSLRIAITDWAKDSNDLVVYLAGLGTSNQFQINSTETLSGEELSIWLTELEKTLPGKVTVVIESDNAGSFIKALATQNRPRIVIASSSANQPALMADHGVNSFSYSVWSQVMDGASLQTAFFVAQKAISPFIANNQPLQSQGDANGDGQSNLQDLTAIGDYCLGMCTKTVTTAPVINLTGQPHLTFNAASTLDFNIAVQPAANTNLLEVWALIQPPAVLNADPTNALNLIKIPLSCDARQQCTGRYQYFDSPGQYRVHFYAFDTHYKLSDPVFLDITIQAQNPSALPADYDDQQGLLTLHDVDVNGLHYQAALQYQNGLYHLLTLGLTPSLFSPAATFDTTSNLLTIPLAQAFGQDYQGSFKLVDNYLFQLLSATPR